MSDKNLDVTPIKEFFTSTEATDETPTKKAVAEAHDDTATEEVVISFDAPDKISLLHSTVIEVFVEKPPSPDCSNVMPETSWSPSAIKPGSLSSNTSLNPSNTEELFPSPEISRYVDSKELEDVVEAERRIQAEAEASAMRQFQLLGIHQHERLRRSNSLLFADSFLKLNGTPDLPNFPLTSSPAVQNEESLPQTVFSSPNADITSSKLVLRTIFNQGSPLSTIKSEKLSSIELKRSSSITDEQPILLYPKPIASSRRGGKNSFACEIEQFLIDQNKS